MKRGRFYEQRLQDVVRAGVSVSVLLPVIAFPVIASKVGSKSKHKENHHVEGSSYFDPYPNACISRWL